MVTEMNNIKQPVNGKKRFGQISAFQTVKGGKTYSIRHVDFHTFDEKQNPRLAWDDNQVPHLSPYPLCNLGGKLFPKENVSQN